jgi:hypothetical protein
MADVAQLSVPTVSAQRREAILAGLRTALEEAERGEYDGIFIIATHPDSPSIRQIWTANLSKLDVLGRLELLKWKIMHQDFEDDAGGCSRGG